MEMIATCPACGLMCDDIKVNTTTGDTANGCPKAVKFFESAYANLSAKPMIQGNAAELDQAINAAAKLLKNSQQPLFAGLGTEVKGMRAIIDLAKKTNASLDHMHSEGTVNNTLSLQNIGYQTTTLTEVKNRADAILVIGTTLNDSHPKFFEKLVWPSETLFDKATPSVAFVGLPSSTKPSELTASTAPDGKTPTAIYADNGALPTLINTLNALLNSKSPLQTQADDTDIAGVKLGDLKGILKTLQAAKYGVVVWSASQLKTTPHAELATQSIIQFINKLNETNRVAGLPLNSGDGDTTVNNTSAWVTGYATRSRFVDGKPAYDAYTISTKNMLSQCDRLLWISSFNAIAPPESNAPTIVIGHPNTALEKTPDVFIPVTVPGVQSDGIMFRMDSSVSLPLKTLNNDANLPTLAAVIKKIESALV